MGVTTTAQPNITSNVRGYMVIDILGTDLHPRFATFDPFMNRLTNWTVDASGFPTFGSVTLTANQEVIYGLIDGLDGIGYWKVVYNNPNGER